MRIPVAAVALCFLTCAHSALADPAAELAYQKSADWNQWDAYDWNERDLSSYGKKNSPYLVDENPNYEIGSEDWYLFRSGEVFIDMFYANLKVKKIGDNVPYGDEQGGGGLGLGWYFHRNVGFLVDGFIADGNPVVDGGAATNILIRVPVDSWAIAFYGLAGPGYEWGREDQWSVQVGGGFDLRLLDHLSTFFDARYIEPKNEISSTLFRVGVRLQF